MYAPLGQEPTARGCVADSECGPGTRCEEGVCVPGYKHPGYAPPEIECFTHEDCGMDAVCYNAVCIPKPPIGKTFVPGQPATPAETAAASSPWRIVAGIGVALVVGAYLMGAS